jgi:hypothetical protein
MSWTLNEFYKQAIKLNANVCMNNHWFSIIWKRKTLPMHIVEYINVHTQRKTWRNDQEHERKQDAKLKDLVKCIQNTDINLINIVQSQKSYHKIHQNQIKGLWPTSFKHKYQSNKNCSTLKNLIKFQEMFSLSSIDNDVGVIVFNWLRFLRLKEWW